MLLFFLQKFLWSENKRTFLVLNSNDNGTVKPSDVRLILPSSAIRSGTKCAAKS